MAIDPKKLSAMAGAVRRPAPPSNLVAARKKKAVPPPDPEEEEGEEEDEEEDEDLEEEAEGEEGEDLEEEGAEEGEESDADEQAEGNYPPPAGGANPGAAIPALEQYASEVEAACDELDYDLLTDPELEMTDDDLSILQEGVLMLPPRFLKVIENLRAIDWDAAQTISAHLQEEGMIEDADKVAGWIFRVGQALDDGETGDSEMVPKDEYTDPEEEDELEAPSAL